MKSVQTVPVAKDPKLLMFAHPRSRHPLRLEKDWSSGQLVGMLFSNPRELGGRQVGHLQEAGKAPDRDGAKCLPSSPGSGQGAGRFLLEHCFVLLSQDCLYVRSDKHLCFCPFTR